MSMTNEEINEMQTYLQMYDKGLLSKKTVLEKIGIDPIKEQEEIKKDIEFDKQRYTTGFGTPQGGCCTGPA